MGMEDPPPGAAQLNLQQLSHLLAWLQVLHILLGDAVASLATWTGTVLGGAHSRRGLQWWWVGSQWYRYKVVSGTQLSKAFG